MNEDRKSVYIESTIPGYATSRPNRDSIIAGHQAATVSFWEQERHKYDLFISQYVLDEIREGDSEAAQKRLRCVADIQVYPKSAEIDAMGAIYLKLLDIPGRAKTDCNHLAICVIHRINYLLTWNCTHLGTMAQMKIQDYNKQHGLWTPLLTTPEALLTYKELIL
jgi:hypothetical protein